MITSRKHCDYLYRALKLHHSRDIVSFVGGGGKTTAMLRIAKELHDAGRRVLLTTTTHMEQDGPELIRYPGELTPELVNTINAAAALRPALVAKRMVRGGKIKGITLQQVAALNREVSFDYMLIEADGARKKPLKAPHRHEPRVPQCTTLFAAVIGYDAVGKKLNISNVHRPQLIARIIKKPIDSVIGPEDIIALLKHPQGLLKGRPPATRTAVIINKVTGADAGEARDLAYAAMRCGRGITSVICGEVDTRNQLLLFT